MSQSSSRKDMGSGSVKKLLLRKNLKKTPIKSNNDRHKQYDPHAPRFNSGAFFGIIKI